MTNRVASAHPPAPSCEPTSASARALQRTASRQASAAVSGEANVTARRSRAFAASSGVVLCLLALACKEPPVERGAPERTQRARRIAAEEEAQRVPPAKPTSPVAAPGAAEPPLRAAEVPQRITGQEDLPTPGQLPVALDFQAETAATIVRGNYHSELNNLESEMKTEGH